MTTYRYEIEHRILPRVAKPNRYIGNHEFTDIRYEAGSAADGAEGSYPTAADRFATAELRVLVLHPDLFESGFHDPLSERATALVRRTPGCFADGAFLPWPDLAAALLRESIPTPEGAAEPLRLWGIESFRPAAEFDLIIATPRAPLQALAVLRLLESGGFALRAADRSDSAPLTLLMGAGAANPAPLAPAFDVVGCGAVEALLPPLLETLRGLRGTSRSARRAALCRLPGFLAAERLTAVAPAAASSDADRVRAVLPSDWGAFDPPDPAVPLVEVGDDALPLVIRRGGAALRFRGDAENWVAPWDIGPERAFTGVEAALRRLGAERVDLTGDAAADHPALGRLVEGLVRRHPGLRVHLDDFGRDQPDPALARELLRGKRSTFAWSPWAGSARLRGVLNVDFDEDRFLNAVATALRGGCHLLRLRFGVGWPTERPEDLEALCDLVRRVRALGGQASTPPRIQVQLEPFLPEPHTPFQWEALLPWEELAGRLADLRRRLEQGPVQVRHAPLEQLQLEASLWRGSSRLFEALENALRQGATAGHPGEPWDPAPWLAGWAAAGIDLDQVTAPRDAEAPLPWDALAVSLPLADLRAERGRALAGHPAERTILAERAEACVVRCALPAPPQATDAAPADIESRAFGRRGRRRTGPTQLLTAARFRLHFAKDEVVRFTAHLDVGRWFERALRRLELSVGGGRRRTFKLSFGPPLPLGMTGDDEYLDLQFSEEVSEAFLDGLGRYLPPGCRLLDAKAVRSSVESLSQAIDLAEYRITFPPALIDALPGSRRAGFLDRLESAVSVALATTDIPVVRAVDGPVVNVRPALLAATLASSRAGAPCLDLKLQLTAPGGGRPELLLPALCGEPELDPRLARIHRVSLRISGAGREFTPLQVVELGFPWWRDTLRRQSVGGRP